jgi:hypothetical protein
MAAFYWSNGPSSGGAVTMYLTIVGEVRDLDVRSSPSTMAASVPVTGFQQCIPSQTVTCGPVPLQFLPLSANARGCGAPQIEPVPTAVSASPGDPTGPGPFCDALTAGGMYTYTTPGGSTQPGGGGGPTGGPGAAPASPREACDAAQNSALLDLARARFNYACLWLRADQANFTAYTAGATAAWGVAGGLAAAAASTPWPANLVLAILAVIAAAIALALTLLAAFAASAVSQDLQRLMDAQTIWRNAIAAVRRACCPAWIVIQTDDLVCP